MRLRPNIFLVIIWIIFIFAVSLYAVSNFDFTPTFPYYQMLEGYPESIRFTGHFDGINYLRIVTKGYPKEGGEVAFFPLYPMIIRYISNFGVKELYVALAISVLSLLLLPRLIQHLYKNHSLKTLILLLSFPTSFYLISAYTEGLFLLELAVFLILLKKKKWLPAALLAGIASGTRLVGAILGPILVVEYLRASNFTLKKPNINKLSISAIFLIISDLGLILYVLYLQNFLADPLAFIHVQPQFNMGRSGGEIILLPQVIYRYGMMVLTTEPSSSIFLRIIWELLTFTGVLYFILKYWRRFDLTEKIYLSWATLLPTFSGTLVSFPRYALVLLPLFAMHGKLANRRSFWSLVTFNIILLVINIIAFTRGFFVA